MTYRIGQSESYVGNDYWEWSAWIEGAEEELDLVEKVVWILHPTFFDPRRTVRTRKNQFRLDASGWGVFRLRAEIYRPSEDEPTLISKVLVLTYPDTADKAVANKDASESSKFPTLFLSYASEDADQAQVLRSRIEEMGAKVVDGTAIPAGSSVSAATRKLIRESDGVIGVFGSSYTSPWVLDEMKLAAGEEMPVIAVTSKQATSDLLSRYQIVELDDEEGAAAQLSSFVGSVGAKQSG